MKQKSIKIWRSNSRGFFWYSIFALGVAATVCVQLYVSRVNRIAEARTTLENYLDISSRAVGAVIRSIDTILFHIATHENNGREPKVNASDLVSSKLFFRDLGEVEFGVFDSSGKKISSTDPAEFNSIAELPHFQKIQTSPDNGLLVSEPIRPSSRSPRSVIILSRPIRNSKGELIGAIAAAVDVSLFASMERELNLGPKALFAIVTGDKKIFAFRNSLGNELVGKPFTYHPALTPVAMRERNQGIYETVSVNDGVWRLTGAVWVGDSDVLIVIGRNFTDILAQWRVECIVFLSIIVSVIILGFIGVALFFRQNEMLTNHQSQLVASSRFVALGEMSSGIAHEINNPLAILIGKIGILRTKVEEDQAEKSWLLHEIARLESTAGRITKIIHGLRNFSRESSRDPMSWVLLEQILNDTLELCAERFKAQSVELRIKKTFDPSIEISCRPAEISQVLINLLTNSFDAIEDREQKWIELEVKVLGSMIQFSVTDSGKGISPEIADKMMQPFFTTKQVGKGTGLGLSISKGIVEGHSGILRFDPLCPNTRFVVEIPLAGSQAKTVERKIS